MSKDRLNVVGFVNMLKEEVRIQDCIHHFQYQKHHGRISAWVLYLDWQEHRDVMILSLWLLIDFLRWHILFHVKILIAILFFKEIVRLHGLPIIHKLMVGNLLRCLVGERPNQWVLVFP